MKHSRLTFLLTWAIWLTACGPEASKEDLAGLPWPQIEGKAKGTTVHLMMWQGDPYINAYMNNYVVPEVKKQLDIDLEIAGGQGATIVSTLMAEKQAGKAASNLDLTWINGETFYQLRQLDALYGPFTDRLPNARYIDFSNRFIGYDFGQPVNGYEAPWGNVQMCLIYDSLRTPQPPRTLAALETYVKAHPGTFTLGTDFTGMTLLKSFLTELAGGPGVPGRQVRRGEVPPPFGATVGVSQPGEAPFLEGGPYVSRVGGPDAPALRERRTAFTMSNNDGEVDNKILQGLFPPTARAYVLDAGTIQNSHYLGIVAHSANKAGPWRWSTSCFRPRRNCASTTPRCGATARCWPSRSCRPTGRPGSATCRSAATRRAARKLDAKALPELAPEYMIRLYDDFRKKVVGA
jgi:putative spermidine/putrescine transport system substrate-binding protein